MYVNAIEAAAQFTRPIHSISRAFGSETVHAGAATLFFVNSDGWALTCKHVAEQLVIADQLVKRRQTYRSDLVATNGTVKERTKRRRIARKHNLQRGETIELLHKFVDCVEGNLAARIVVHPDLDIALIQFTDFTRLLCDRFPVFAEQHDQLKPGMFLCRLGYPFPEFTDYAYDDASDSIHWTTSGRPTTPRFPIDGMVTRHLLGTTGSVIGFEMSTPGLRGQSGGPVFDTEGRIWGIQSATAHLDLDFDIDQTVIRQGREKRVAESAFLHIGHCIHVSELKKFMTEQGVRFETG